MRLETTNTGIEMNDEDRAHVAHSLASAVDQTSDILRRASERRKERPAPIRRTKRMSGCLVQTNSVSGVQP